MKGGHLEKKHEKLTLAYFSLQANICLSQRTYIYHYVIKCIGDHRYRLFLSNNKKKTAATTTTTTTTTTTIETST